MRLLCDKLGIDIELSENKPQIVTIEDVALYSGFVRELWEEYKGNDGDILISDKGTDLKFGKNIEVVINPFDIDCNNKKILTRIYQETVDIIQSEKIIETLDINSKIVALLDETVNKLPYDLDYNLELNLQSLLKMYDLTVRMDAENYPELLSQYIKLMANACGIRCFVFVGLKKYLATVDLENLYKDIVYDKIYLVDIESDISQRISTENVAILDKDRCLIVY